MLDLATEQQEEYKQIYQDILGLGKENLHLDTEDYLSIKKVLLLYNWISDKEIKEIEEEYQIYNGAIQKLVEGFSWLADALGAIAKSLDWDQKENREKDLSRINILSERLTWGVEEEGLPLARLHIPGLSRNYIRALVREGYDNKKCLQQLSQEELTKILPQRLAKRIKKRINTDNFDSKLAIENRELITVNCKPKTCALQPIPRNPKLKTVLQIDSYRPDRIIFEGKEIKVTARGFSLLYLLAQHNGQVISYDKLLDELWKDEEDAIYNRVSFHISKIRRTILKIIGESKTNKEKVIDIFVVVPGRGVMLKLKAEELKIH